MSVVSTSSTKMVAVPTKPRPTQSITSNKSWIQIIPQKPHTRGLSQKSASHDNLTQSLSPNPAMLNPPQKLSEPKPHKKPSCVLATSRSSNPSRSEKERQTVTAFLLEDENPTRVLHDYPIKAKSLKFRQQFDDFLARSYVWVPKAPDSFHELLGVVSNTAALLGFEEASIRSMMSAKYSTITCAADLSRDGLDLTESRLSLLWIRPPEYSWSQLRNYLVYHRVDSQYDGIINKWLLIANLQDSDQRLEFKTQSGAAFKSDCFLPMTVRMDKPLDELLNVLAANQGTYIIKGVRGTKGQNINLLRLHGRRNSSPSIGDKQQNQQQDLLKILKKSGLLRRRLTGTILQKYIERPLLVDKRKFDFRVYMLMVNACREDKQTGEVKKNLYVFYHPGFLRLCIMAYQVESDNLFCHLTNQSIQMKSILYDHYKEATIWEPDELNKYFNSKGTLPASDYVRDVLYPKIGAIVGYLGAAFAETLNDSAIQANTFKIFGIDFLVDSGLSVLLLEVNDFPSWMRQTNVLARLKSDLWREAVALTVETVVKFRQAEPLEPLISRCNFRLVHSTDNPAVLADSIASHFE